MRWIATSADYPAIRAALEKALSSPGGVALPPDLARWIEHLWELRSGLDAGVLNGAALTADEAEGLRLLHEVMEGARAKRKCWRCGVATDALYTCTECGADLNSPSARGGQRK